MFREILRKILSFADSLPDMEGEEESSTGDTSGTLTGTTNYSTKTINRTPSKTGNVTRKPSKKSINSLSTVPHEHSRPENILQFTIQKMQGDFHENPGGVSVQSLTNLICCEYGWPRAIVRDKVKRALHKAVGDGRAKIFTLYNEVERYTVSDNKLRESLSTLRDKPARRKKMIKTIKKDLSRTVKFKKNQKE